MTPPPLLIRRIVAATALVVSLNASAAAQSAGDSTAMQIFANPACQGFTVRVGVPTPSLLIEIVAYDYLGRMKAAVIRLTGGFAEGVHDIPCSLRGVDGERLPDGFYVLVARADGHAIGIAKLVVSCSPVQL